MSTSEKIKSEKQEGRRIDFNVKIRIQKQGENIIILIYLNALLDYFHYEDVSDIIIENMVKADKVEPHRSNITYYFIKSITRTDLFCA